MQDLPLPAFFSLHPNAIFVLRFRNSQILNIVALSKVVRPRLELLPSLSVTCAGILKLTARSKFIERAAFWT